MLSSKFSASQFNESGKLMREKLDSFLKNEFSGYSLFFAFFSQYILSLILGIVVFRQFLPYEIFSVSIVFLLVFLFLVYLFNREKLKFNTSFSPRDVIIGLTLLLGGVISFAGATGWFSDYFPVYPILNASLGGTVHLDPVYHVSLIQSILNFGYPSTAQHDSVVTIYHVLSHYVDAFILLVTGLEAFDTYGLFYYFKITIYIMSIWLFIWRITLNKSIYVFIASFLLLTPFITGSWHAVASHSLWFTSLLIILSAPKVFDILERKTITNSHFFLLFILITLVILGKISSGFMYAVFIGSVLFIKHPKDWRIYLLGGCWCVVLYVFSQLFSDNFQGELRSFSISTFFDSLFHVRVIKGALLPLLFFWGLNRLIKSKRTRHYLWASNISVLILVLIIQMMSTFSGSDIFYFVFGLNFVFILFLFMIVLASFDVFKKNIRRLTKQYNNLKLIVFFTTFFLLFSIVSSREGGYFFYENINSVLPSNKRISITNLYNQPSNIKTMLSGNQLYIFRSKLYDFMNNNNLKKETSLLFVPKKVFEHDFDWIKMRHDNVRGELVYATVGVPLIYGVKKLIKVYGYSDYTTESLWKERWYLNNKLCDFDKNIIIVENWKKPSFSLTKCNNN